TSSLFCIGFLILYSSNMYGDEIYLCNKAVIKYREWLINIILEILLNIKSNASIEEARLLIYIIDSSIIQSLINDEIDHREYIWSYFSSKISL
ncbi:hypothetical protein V7H98_10670, partial [Acinetobacter baumannii]